MSINTNVLSVRTPVATEETEGDFVCQFSICENGGVSKGDAATLTVMPRALDSIEAAKAEFDRYTGSEYFNLRKQHKLANGSVLMFTRTGTDKREFAFIEGNLLVLVGFETEVKRGSTKNSLQAYEVVLQMVLDSVTLKPTINDTSRPKAKQFQRPDRTKVVQSKALQRPSR